MRGKEFIRFADSLSKRSAFQESLVRTAISRYYYGAFLEVRDFLMNLRSKGRKHIPNLKNNPKVHILTARHIGNEGYTEIAYMLSKLHQLRKIADYDINIPVTVADMKFARVLSKTIIQILGV